MPFEFVSRIQFILAVLLQNYSLNFEGQLSFAHKEKNFLQKVLSDSFLQWPHSSHDFFGINASASDFSNTDSSTTRLAMLPIDSLSIIFPPEILSDIWKEEIALAIAVLLDLAARTILSNDIISHKKFFSKTKTFSFAKRNASKS